MTLGASEIQCAAPRLRGRLRFARTRGFPHYGGAAGKALPMKTYPSTGSARRDIMDPRSTRASPQTVKATVLNDRRSTR